MRYALNRAYSAMSVNELRALAIAGDGKASQALFERMFANVDAIKYDTDVALSKALAAL